MVSPSFRLIVNDFPVVVESVSGRERMVSGFDVASLLYQHRGKGRWQVNAEGDLRGTASPSRVYLELKSEGADGGLLFFGEERFFEGSGAISLSAARGIFWKRLRGRGRFLSQTRFLPFRAEVRRAHWQRVFDSWQDERDSGAGFAAGEFDHRIELGDCECSV